MARFMLHIMAAFAELEREMIRERVRSGMNPAKHRGQQLGRRRLVFDRSKVTALHDSGTSVCEIAKPIEIGAGTVHRCLAASASD